MSSELRNARPTVLAAIVASAVLHNIAIAAGEPLPDGSLEADLAVLEDPVPGANLQPDQGHDVRAALANTMFK